MQCGSSELADTSFDRPYVTRITKIVFDLAVKFKILRAWGPSNDLESGHVNTRAEAERRRYALSLDLVALRSSNACLQCARVESPRSALSLQASTKSRQYIEQSSRSRHFSWSCSSRRFSDSGGVDEQLRGSEGRWRCYV